MVVMRCISVLTFRQDERSCSNSIEQQRLPVSTFARWFALTFSIILNCSCVIPFFFRKSRIQIRLYFTKANLLINYHRVFFPSSPFCGGTWQIHTTNSQEWISALELHIFHYKLVSKTSICLSLQRNHIKFSTFFTGLIFTIPRKKLNAISV